MRSSHPDLHPDDKGAEARFKAISAAYELLKDPESRAKFDAGEIDAAGAERPQRQYYRDFADSPNNTYNQNGGFARALTLRIFLKRSCEIVPDRVVAGDLKSVATLP